MVGMKQFFHIDSLSLIMIGLVGFVAISIASFSNRYLKGDRRKNAFFFYLLSLVLTIFVMVSADHLFLLLISWSISNFLLTQLMLHKKEWEPARQSSLLAMKNFGLGFLFLGSSFLILYTMTGETSIRLILKSSFDFTSVVVVSLLMLLAAMTQSSLWPFHRWLLSSLNSPTPVSAIMHAGLVNGGGFLLARFAPLLMQQSAVLNIVFMVGMLTTLLGTSWMLMQSDIKRILACSTMGQMGFMIAQCGLGLFPAAVAHLCLHGLFKAYLFLASGSAGQKKRFNVTSQSPQLKHFLLALICGFFGSYAFLISSAKDLFVFDTNLFLVILTMVAGIQFSLPIVQSRFVIRFPLALILTWFMGLLYGSSVHVLEHILEPLNIFAPQPLNAFHLFSLFVMVMTWMIILFANNFKQERYPNWILKIYVQMLNASQPHPKTVTTHRNQYQL